MKKITLILAITFCLTSCYTHRYSVGKGAQVGIKSKQKNHYLLNGLAAIHTSNPEKMANGKKDYDVKISHTFIDQLIAFLTGGIYTPTTTKVTLHRL
ncbi:Bor family protein [Tenacibaculum maritimum]|uniref:Bor family protein n=1 Tax=Tenacibaculum maritimum TaxID=107401 RepID=UPI00387781A6